MICQICQCPLAEGEPRHTCGECKTPYHQECYEDNQGCAVYGCANVPNTEQLESFEVPTGYWGQEDWPCPNCGKLIKAVAKRCKHCATVFNSDRPQERTEYQQGRQLQVARSSTQTGVLAILGLSLLPFTAPVAAVAGPLWWASRRDHVNSLDALHAGLLRVGVGVAWLETFLMGSFALAYLMKGGT
ncbi:MAG: hypothetical protein AB7S38_08290 [Vulcanimicrobiota bacterium]